MNGQLRDHPLAELIHEITGARLSGALRLAHERVKGAVYFEGGEVVAALTNLRAQRLSEVLRRERGGSVAARLEELLGSGVPDERAAAALVEGGELSAAELDAARARQSAEALRELLGWAEGEWAFDPRVRLAGDYRARLDVPSLLVEGARSLPQEFVAGRMADEGEILSPASEVLDEATVRGLQLLPTEAFALTRASGPMSLGELIAVSGLPEVETRRALYALALGGLLRRARWPLAFSPEMLARARSTSSTPRGERREDAPPPPPPTTAAPAPEQPTPPAQSEAAKPEAEKTPREEMEELFERARAATHYSVLGVTRSASPAEIKSIYYALARRFHPDRFRRDSDEGLQQQLDNSFARVTQAYEVLKDASLRAAYDLKLNKTAEAEAAATAEAAEAKAEAARQAAPESPPPSPALSRESALLYRAEDKYQQGLAALQQNNTALATRLLGEAAILVPKQARYRALYGRALSREKRSRRQAETELLAAVGLDEKNPAYRVMLAELYVEIGLRRRAEGELERALAFDPSHAAARRLLRELRASK
jgi:curved DNA-binding protein CbpA